MTDDSRLAVVEREVRGMHETVKEVANELKALNRSVIQSEQQHLQHQQATEQSKTSLERCSERTTELERKSERQDGAISLIRWFFGAFAGVAIAWIGWLLSVVLSTQSATQIQQSKQSTVEARLQILEQRRGGP